MMTADDRDFRPPKKVSRPGTPLPAGDTTTSTPARIKTSSCHLDCRSAQRQCRRNSVGRYTLGFEDGFLRGRVDALRCAMREIDDLDVLVVFTRLADEYTLAAGDS
jgi:hypothetical protein